VAQPPGNVVLAWAFVTEPAVIAFERVSELTRWPDLFGGWTAHVAQVEDHFTATGPEGERFDLYPTSDREALAIDVEVVDELGAADTLRLRVIDAPGGCFVVAAHAKLAGTPEAQWHAKRDAVAAGLDAIASLL